MTQRSRDIVTGPLTLDYFMRKAAEGWTVVAIDWVRTVEMSDSAASDSRTSVNLQADDVPYGLRISDNGLQLETNPIETMTLLLILERIVMEKRLNQIADDLNERGLRTRRGTAWTSSSLFDLLPRLIEMGPTLLKSPEWQQRRDQIATAHRPM